MKTDYIAENILIAILAVNGWTADRVFPLTERFRASGCWISRPSQGCPSKTSRNDSLVPATLAVNT